MMTIMKRQKISKTWVGIFKNNGGNIPLGDFLGGISPGGEGGSFVGWNFPGWSFPDTNLKIE